MKIKNIIIAIFVSLWLSFITNALAALTPLTDFSQQITVDHPPKYVGFSKTVNLKVSVRNIGKEIWQPKSGIYISYRWFDKNNKVVVASSVPLTAVVKPGTSTDIELPVTTPVELGLYILRLSMLQNNVDWFDNKGGKPLNLPIEVVIEKNEKWVLHNISITMV